MKEAMRLYPAVLVVVREVRSYLLHRSPYGRVGAVNADPRGLLPSSLSAYVTVSIHDLDAFRLQPTPFNFTPTSLRTDPRPSVDHVPGGRGAGAVSRRPPNEDTDEGP
jgi:hypothetical protein